MNIILNDFIPIIISIISFNLIGSIALKTIISCRLNNYISTSKTIIFLILIKIIYIGVIFKHNLVEGFSNYFEIKYLNNKRTENFISKTQFKYKHILLTLFYLIILIILFKTSPITFLLFYVIISINFILDIIKYQTPENSKLYNSLELSQFILSIISYFIIIIGHIIYIGEQKYEFGKEFRLLDVYRTPGVCNFSKNIYKVSYWKLFLTGLNINKVKL